VQSSIFENIQVEKYKYLFAGGHYVMETICQEAI